MKLSLVADLEEYIYFVFEFIFGWNFWTYFVDVTPNKQEAKRIYTLEIGKENFNFTIWQTVDDIWLEVV